MNLWLKAWHNVMDRPSKKRYERAKRCFSDQNDSERLEVVALVQDLYPDVPLCEIQANFDKILCHEISEYEKPKGTLKAVFHEYQYLKRLHGDWLRENGLA